MVDILRMALVPVIVVGSSTLYSRRPALVLSAIRTAMLLAAAIVVALAVTGLPRWASSEIHRIAGHVFIIVLWLLVPAAAGVAIGAAIQSRRWLRMAVHVGKLLALLGAGFLAAVTGYLPSGPEASPPQQLRFLVLHVVAFPVLLISLIVIWILLSRGYARVAHNKPLQPTSSASGFR